MKIYDQSMHSKNNLNYSISPDSLAVKHYSQRSSFLLNSHREDVEVL